NPASRSRPPSMRLGSRGGARRPRTTIARLPSPSRRDGEKPDITSLARLGEPFFLDESGATRGGGQPARRVCESGAGAQAAAAVRRPADPRGSGDRRGFVEVAASFIARSDFATAPEPTPARPS